MKKQTISVIIPTLNMGRFIEGGIEFDPAPSPAGR